MARLLHTLDLNKRMRADILSNFEGIEDVLAFESGNEMLLCYVGLVELVTIKVVFFHVAVLFRLFEFVQSLDDVRDDFDFFLLREFGVEVVGSKRLLQKR